MEYDFRLLPPDEADWLTAYNLLGFYVDCGVTPPPEEEQKVFLAVYFPEPTNDVAPAVRMILDLWVARELADALYKTINDLDS